MDEVRLHLFLDQLNLLSTLSQDEKVAEAVPEFRLCFGYFTTLSLFLLKSIQMLKMAIEIHSVLFQLHRKL